MYRQARYDEPCIFELGCKGARGHVVPAVEHEIKDAIGDSRSYIPQNMRRDRPPEIPELSEVEVMRHFFRLSQESTCVDSGFNAEGTCTMKYNPKINESLAGSAKVANLHPFQDEESVQGMLEVLHRLGECFKAISGFDAVSFQPPSGTLSEFTECLMIAAYHKNKGNHHKTDLIVPYTSHGTNAVAAKMAGFNVITIDQLENGNLDLEALKVAVTDRTAGMIQTNPTSLSVFDPNLLTMADMIHEVGGVFAYDAANTNSVMGRAKPRDLKFDLVHYNAHKAFSSPHGGYGPGMGVVVVSEELAPFLPSPMVAADGQRYYLDYHRPLSIGRIKQFYGNVPNAVRAYAWILAMGPAGIARSTDIAVLNNNYLYHKLQQIQGISVPLAEGRHRMEETVFSLKQMLDETGVDAHHFALRVADFGPNSTFTLGYPLYVEEPWVIEPTECQDKDEIDNFIEIVRRVAAEAYENPRVILNGPQNCAVNEIDMAASENPETMALTWRMYRKKGLEF
jgi:glycine cleavage system P protein (glycine dehydrogenase) subunit 2